MLAHPTQIRSSLGGMKRKLPPLIFSRSVFKEKCFDILNVQSELAVLPRLANSADNIGILGTIKLRRKISDGPVIIIER